METAYVSADIHNNLLPETYIMQSKKPNLPVTALAAIVTGLTIISAPTAEAAFTGNIGVYSKYILRGITNAPENDDPSIQGGVDYAHDSGLYLGYWGSNLGYSDPGEPNGFENDFYGGYAGSAGPVNYSIGLIKYIYINLDNFDGLEAVGTLGAGPVTLGFKYLTNDVGWGNQGDTYWTLGYKTALPADFSFAATLGYYTYEDSGKFIASSEEDSAFRHLDLNISHPIGNTGATAGLTYVIGGKDRNGVDQDNDVVLNITYAFDIIK